jgi:polyphosphate kinase
VQMWLSSADWMSRNMMRRVELAWPIKDPAMQSRIYQESLQLYLQDNKDAWQLTEKGQYVPVAQQALDAEPLSCQNLLLQQYHSM